MGFLAICRSSLEKKIQILQPFLNWLTCLLLLNWRSSLYIVGSITLSDILFANIFSHGIGCCFNFLIVFFDAQIFILLKQIYFFFGCLYFGYT